MKGSQNSGSGLVIGVFDGVGGSRVKVRGMCSAAAAVNGCALICLLQCVSWGCHHCAAVARAIHILRMCCQQLLHALLV